MTAEYITWLGSGILGKSWNFGRLDGTQAVRSWASSLPERRTERGVCAYARARVCVSVRACVCVWF